MAALDLPDPRVLHLHQTPTVGHPVRMGAIHREGRCLIPRVWRADNPLTRLRGLLGRRPLCGNAQEALLLVPCNSVHTFAMGYPLDIVFLDANERVLGWHCGVRPWRARACVRARATLELDAGSVEILRPQPGERWKWLTV